MYLLYLATLFASDSKDSRIKMAPPSFDRFRRTETKNRSNSNSNEQLTSSKKPFNKKLWRQKHYKSKYGNANEGHLLAKKRKIVKEYRKIVRKERQKGEVNLKTISYGDNVTSDARSPMNKKKKIDPFTKAKLEYENKIEEKRKKEEEYARIQKEKEEALKRYKEKKFARHNKMSKKTKKGQPLMKERMELLLETLEKQLAKEQTKKT